MYWKYITINNINKICIINDTINLINLYLKNIDFSKKKIFIAL